MGFGPVHQQLGRAKPQKVLHCQRRAAGQVGAQHRVDPAHMAHDRQGQALGTGGILRGQALRRRLMRHHSVVHHHAAQAIQRRAAGGEAGIGASI
jgi:hypothetical protein